MPLVYEFNSYYSKNQFLHQVLGGQHTLSQCYFLEKCVLKLCPTAVIKLRQIKHSDKLKFIDWSQVKRMFGCGEIAIF